MRCTVEPLNHRHPVMSLERGRAAQRRSMSARFKITFHFRARPRAASTWSRG